MTARWPPGPACRAPETPTVAAPDRRPDTPDARPRRATVPDVSVIVVSWNTRDALRTCLTSLRDGTRGVTFETFVVDNASADGSAEMVRAEFPGVRLIANRENRGFAAGNNQALRLARGRFLLLLNPDTQVVGDALTTAVRIAEEDPTIGALGCQVLLGQDDVQPTCFRFPSLGGLVRTWWGLDGLVPERWLGGSPTIRAWDRRTPRDVEVVSGMFLLVRREAFLQVGPMDEAYFVYAEEADWCWRLRRAGWRCAFTPAAQVLHEGGGGKSTSQVRVRMYVQLQKSLLHFHRKHRGDVAWVLARGIYVVAMASRVAFFRTSSLLPGDAARRERARERLACASAALRFHLFGTEPAR